MESEGTRQIRTARGRGRLATDRSLAAGWGPAIGQPPHARTHALALTLRLVFCLRVKHGSKTRLVFSSFSHETAQLPRVTSVPARSPVHVYGPTSRNLSAARPLVTASPRLAPLITANHNNNRSPPSRLPFYPSPPATSPFPRARSAPAARGSASGSPAAACQGPAPARRWRSTAAASYCRAVTAATNQGRFIKTP